MTGGLLRAVVRVVSAIFVVLSSATATIASAQAGGVPLTAVVVGDEPERSAAARVVAERSALSVELGVTPLPERMPDTRRATTIDLARTRAHYVAAELDACLSTVRDDALLDDALEAEDVTTAARLLFWRTACALAFGDEALARASAEQLAVRELPMPLDVGSVTPDVERFLFDVAAEVRARPRAQLRVSSVPIGARVRLDGRAARCTTPCAIELATGSHHVALDADGFEPAGAQIALAAEGGAHEVTLTRARPERASAQWSLRYGRAADVALDPAAELLGVAVPSRRLLLVGVERSRLVGAYLEDGVVRGRGVREGVAEDDVRALVRLVLERGGVLAPAPEFWELPELWIIVGVVLAGAGAAIGWALYEPPVHTSLRWGEPVREVTP